MTNKHNFKKGDRVKIEIPGICDIGEIIGENAIGGYNVKCGENYHYGVSEAYLEPTSLDRRTAFLTRLQSLLKEFDARISADAEGSYCGDDIKSVSVIINVGDECMEYDMTDCDAVITADNIMDFDKE